jgi:hypothetical protein
LTGGQTLLQGIAAVGIDNEDAPRLLVERLPVHKPQIHQQITTPELSIRQMPRNR